MDFLDYVSIYIFIVLFGLLEMNFRCLIVSAWYFIFIFIFLFVF